MNGFYLDYNAKDLQCKKKNFILQLMQVNSRPAEMNILNDV